MGLNKKILDKRFWLDLIMPNRCCFCNKIISWYSFCCNECAKQIPYIDQPICKLCGKYTCMCSRGLSYDYCFCVVWYNPIMHSAVVKYKVESPDNFCMLFGDNLAKQIKKTNYASNIDIVTCTPMTKKSKRKRGYNQAYELAKVIARFLEVPVTDKILVKNRDNVSQHELTFEERLLNTKNLFGASPSVNLRGKTVLLVDDVITTGSTLNSCTKVLKARGASTVICAAVATTKLHNEKHS